MTIEAPDQHVDHDANSQPQLQFYDRLLQNKTAMLLGIVAAIATDAVFGADMIETGSLGDAFPILMTGVFGLNVYFARRRSFDNPRHLQHERNES